MRGEFFCRHECPTTSMATLDDGAKRASYSGKIKNTQQVAVSSLFRLCRISVAPHLPSGLVQWTTTSMHRAKRLGVSHRYAREHYHPTSVDCVARNLHNVGDTHCRRVGSVLIPGCWTDKTRSRLFDLHSKTQETHPVALLRPATVTPTAHILTPVGSTRQTLRVL